MNHADLTGLQAGPYGLGSGPYSQSNAVARNAMNSGATQAAAKAAAIGAGCGASGLVAASSGQGFLGNLATGAALAKAGAAVFGGSVAPAAGILASSATGASAAAGGTAAVGATFVLAATGFYVTALGTTTMFNAVNQTFGTNLATFSNAPSPVRFLFPNLAGPPSLPGLPSCGCGP